MFTYFIFIIIDIVYAGNVELKMFIVFNFIFM